MKKIIGVMGNSHGEIPEDSLKSAYIVGEEIAKNGLTLLTGGTLGSPEQAVLGAKKHGGTTIAISPATNIDEHQDRYHQSRESDYYIFTGFGDMGRNIFNIKSSDALIFVGGGMGTLSEFAIAYAEGKTIGVLINSGGISDIIQDVIVATKKKAKGKIFFDENPVSLVKQIVNTF